MKIKPIKIFYFFTCLIVFGCHDSFESKGNNLKEKSKQYITVLGIAQDAGFPQIDCDKNCCTSIYKKTETKKMVSCLGLVDLETKSKWLFDATPDISEQMQVLKINHLDTHNTIDGVFLTHAHIGHYTGLMYFGREALGGKNIPVYAMPKMTSYLKNNGPWSQLVTLNNIVLEPLYNDSTMVLNTSLKVTPFLVPHRDEYSETVGYKIEGENKSALFIPDIDKWHVWQKDIISEVKKVDYAFLDASFFRDGELDRDMNEIPHPFTSETTTLFENESLETKNKIYFIHFNHTNPAIKDSHQLKDSIQNLGFHFAKEGAIFQL
jgi:pyrroloquinoline quinone biosynthesis protein B